MSGYSECLNIHIQCGYINGTSLALHLLPLGHAVNGTSECSIVRAVFGITDISRRARNIT